MACLALPSLHQLSQNQAIVFRKNVRGLIEADRKWTIFEYAIQRFVSKRLADRLQPRERGESATSSDSILQSFQKVLSTLARLGNNPSMVESAFAAGLAAVPKMAKGLELSPSSECTLKKLDEALNILERSRGTMKRSMLAACSACIAADGKVEVRELELLRVISDALGCPMPPVIQISW